MCKNKKLIALLGSTGSIGQQTLGILDQHRDLFEVGLITANKNYKLLFNQALSFCPKYVVINDLKGFRYLKKNLSKKNTKVLLGANEVCEIIKTFNFDLVVSAMVGSAGLLPTISAIKSKTNVALANKETLVVAGELIMDLAHKNNVSILPIDSEHSALFQCLVGEDPKSISRLILTASGGPFLKIEKADLKKVTVEQALKHPNWNMGAKISIDSATMMNKGLEVIEARWLFGVSHEKIKVLIHDESIIHSLVEFCDNSIKAQLGAPDMKTPISYSLFYPKRKGAYTQDWNIMDLKSLNFSIPDTNKFPHLALAYSALEAGGTAPCALNAANEIAVDAFLNKKISYLDMFKIVEKSLENFIFVNRPNIDDYLRVDLETRSFAKKIISKL
tara:strand:- start:20823 stop:21989 length:1167 start_codon:yes stop_codon:yes gene_type:complete